MWRHGVCACMRQPFTQSHQMIQGLQLASRCQNDADSCRVQHKRTAHKQERAAHKHYDMICVLATLSRGPSAPAQTLSSRTCSWTFPILCIPYGWSRLSKRGGCACLYWRVFFELCVCVFVESSCGDSFQSLCVTWLVLDSTWSCSVVSPR